MKVEGVEVFAVAVVRPVMYQFALRQLGGTQPLSIFQLGRRPGDTPEYFVQHFFLWLIRSVDNKKMNASSITGISVAVQSVVKEGGIVGRKSDMWLVDIDLRSLMMQRIRRNITVLVLSLDEANEIAKRHGHTSEETMALVGCYIRLAQI